MFMPEYSIEAYEALTPDFFAGVRTLPVHPDFDGEEYCYGAGRLDNGELLHLWGYNAVPGKGRWTPTFDMALVEGEDAPVDVVECGLSFKGVYAVRLKDGRVFHATL